MGIFKELKDKYFSNNRNIHGCKVVNQIPKVDMMRILRLFEEGKFNSYSSGNPDIEYVSKGSYGSVFKYKGVDGSIYKIKTYLGSDSPCDGRALEKLQGSEYYPKLFFYIPYKIVVSEFVEGELFRDFIYSFGNSPKDKEELADKIEADLVKSIKFALKKKVTPRDMHTENIVINSKTRNPVIIDVGCFDVSHRKWSESFKFDKNNGAKNQYEDLKWEVEKLRTNFKEKEKKRKRTGILFHAEPVFVDAVRGGRSNKIYFVDK